MLTVLFLSSRATGRPRRWQIWAGQSLGIATLVAVSVVAALGLTIVPDQWVGLLGLVPFGLGVRGLLRAQDPDPPVVATGVLSVAGWLSTVGEMAVSSAGFGRRFPDSPVRAERR